MASRVKRLGWFSVLLGLAMRALFAAILPAQMPQLPETADAVLLGMARVSGIIFAGQVMAVRGPTGFADGGVVEVDFRVDQSVRGPKDGSVYTLREWAGLWSGSPHGGGRFRIGQRLLVFLYAPGADGLTSPVHGMDGAVPLRGAGVAPGPDDTTSALAEWMVDLRWLQAQTSRSDATIAMPVRGPLHPRPIRTGPVSPRPINDSATGGRFEPPAADVEPSLTRRPPVFTPQPVSPRDAQPLAQVIALCQQAMDQPAPGRQAVSHSSPGDQAADEQTIRGADAVR